MEQLHPTTPKCRCHCHCHCHCRWCCCPSRRLVGSRTKQRPWTTRYDLLLRRLSIAASESHWNSQEHYRLCEIVVVVVVVVVVSVVMMVVVVKDTRLYLVSWQTTTDSTVPGPRMWRQRQAVRLLSSKADGPYTVASLTTSPVPCRVYSLSRLRSVAQNPHDHHNHDQIVVLSGCRRGTVCSIRPLQPRFPPWLYGSKDQAAVQVGKRVASPMLLLLQRNGWWTLILIRRSHRRLSRIGIGETQHAYENDAAVVSSCSETW